MEKSIITTGKTIDLAVAAALEQLQMDRDSVSVEVLENPRSGFLGFGATPAKIKVTYDDPNAEPEVKPEEPAAPKAALSSASRNMPKKKLPAAKQAPAVSSVPKMPTPAAAPKQEKPAAPKAERSESRQSRPERAPRAEQPKREPAPKKEATPLPEYVTPAEGSVEARAEAFIKGLLEQMESDATPKAYRMDEDTVLVDLVGENLGILIGRRGDTLDAIQHLANYAVNREGGKRTRINVDAENYRAKREESLERLARKVAGKVAKYRRSVTLEPMNAYERHVIHAALQDYRDVSTHSTGTEPNRRIVVSYNRK
ncbi:MAG: KH domain-containing protein [Ruminococcaceae bacterium]|nr:KH domain-containing protein [Oscillospiraceae bacterium]